MQRFKFLQELSISMIPVSTPDSCLCLDKIDQKSRRKIESQVCDITENEGIHTVAIHRRGQNNAIAKLNTGMRNKPAARGGPRSLLN
eukprot:COSAG02_NODE_3652_length_6414_cov_10.240222_3_plen_87_part_00